MRHHRLGLQPRGAFLLGRLRLPAGRRRRRAARSRARLLRRRMRRRATLQDRLDPVPGGAVIEIFEFEPQLPPRAGALEPARPDAHLLQRPRHPEVARLPGQSKGVTIVSPPEQSPRGHWFFFVKDFDGNLIEIIDLGHMYYVLKLARTARRVDVPARDVQESITSKAATRDLKPQAPQRCAQSKSLVLGVGRWALGVVGPRSLDRSTLGNSAQNLRMRQQAARRTAGRSSCCWPAGITCCNGCSSRISCGPSSSGSSRPTCSSQWRSSPHAPRFFPAWRSPSTPSSSALNSPSRSRTCGSSPGCARSCRDGSSRLKSGSATAA